jgi:Xaa-Pro aminopeptidase
MGVDALLVTNLTNVRYLTGYTGSNGVIVVRPADAVFLTDFRYLQRVEPLRDLVDVRQAKQDLMRFVSTRWAELAPGAERIGFESAHLTVAAHQRLSDAAGSVELVPTIHVVEDQRAVKDDAEVAAIRRAAGILAPVYDTLLDDGLAGRTEFDVAWRVHELVRKHGGDGVSFDPIVASGEAGALPHAEPRREPIAEGVLVTIDIGARLEGYCSDCTRTFATGPLEAELAEAYEVCLAAQEQALEATLAGAACRAVDAVARDAVDASPFKGLFGHGLGHGVGLEVHEAPSLRPEAPPDALLEPGNVVTIEPGIYLPGRGGIRIEDLVVVTDGEPERLTRYTKQLVEVG